MRSALGRRVLPSTRDGFTLIELLVVLVLLALLSGVAAVALARRAPPGATWRDHAIEGIARARSDALARGEAVSIAVEGPSGMLRATAFPDGRVLADSLLAIEPLTGRRTDRADPAAAITSTASRHAVSP